MGLLAHVSPSSIAEISEFSPRIFRCPGSRVIHRHSLLFSPQYRLALPMASKLQQDSKKEVVSSEFEQKMALLKQLQELGESGLDLRKVDAAAFLGASAGTQSTTPTLSTM